MGTTTYEGVQERLRIRPRTWLVTGVAGFIGSHLLETLLMLVAAHGAGVSRFVYAGSSATYGDRPGLLRVEPEIGRPLSPSALDRKSVV